YPSKRAREEEIANLMAAVIKNKGAPILMKALFGVVVLVKAGSVKFGQTEGICGEVAGHPVHNHTDVCLVELIHEVHEIFRFTVAMGGSEKARDLIAPRACKGVFRQG